MVYRSHSLSTHTFLFLFPAFKLSVLAHRTLDETFDGFADIAFPRPVEGGEG